MAGGRRSTHGFSEFKELCEIQNLEVELKNMQLHRVGVHKKNHIQRPQCSVAKERLSEVMSKGLFCRTAREIRCLRFLRGWKKKKGSW